MYVDELIKELEQWKAPNYEVVVDDYDIKRVELGIPGHQLRLVPNFEFSLNEHLDELEDENDSLKEELEDIEEELDETASNLNAVESELEDCKDRISNFKDLIQDIIFHLKNRILQSAIDNSKSIAEKLVEETLLDQCEKILDDTRYPYWVKG